MSAFFHAADDTQEFLSGFRSSLSDGISIFETATVLSVAAFLTAMLNALV